MKKEFENIIPMFKEEVTKRAKQIDPGNTLDWHSLTVGWAIGKGINTSRRP